MATYRFKETIAAKNTEGMPIARVSKTPKMLIEFINGDVVVFLSDEQYERYCLGRTYKVVGEDLIFHSGLPIGNNYGERKEDGNS